MSRKKAQTSPKVLIADPLDRLRPDAGGCRGAVFTTYTFDALFFEEEVLATLLGLTEDPDNATPRFLEQGRRALRDSPVCVVMDRGYYRGGKRLPYDLRFHPTGRTFHPKVGLTLHRDHARVHVGSGNITKGGYGGNAELGVSLELDLTEHAGEILAVRDFLEACGASGEAWARFDEELHALLPNDAEPANDSPLLHTARGGVLLDDFLARIPAGAKVRRVGVVAPFHQEDGAQPDRALFDRLLDWTKGRRKRGFAVDVGVSWETSPLAPREGEDADLWQRQGQLWARVDGKPGEQSLRYVVLEGHKPHYWGVRDRQGRHWWSSREVNRLVREGRLWPTGEVEAHGPTKLVKRLSRKAPMQLWLHPAVHWRDGRRYAQPLHAKLIAISVVQDGVARTHLLLGSPNASAQALLVDDGNVEAALHLVLDGNLGLAELCPGLVPCPLDQVVLLERSFEKDAPPAGRWVEDAVYDAADRVLRVDFRRGAPALEVVYPAPGKSVEIVHGKPGRRHKLSDLDLHPGCSEIEVTELDSGRSSRVPLRVVAMQELPVEGLSGPLSFEEMVLLHSGRYSSAGLAERRSRQAGDGAGEGGAGLLLGEGATPRDVFRAFVALAESLEDEDASLSAFRATLSGPWGAKAFAERLVDAAGAEILTSEAWLYGQELLRCLAAVDLSRDPAANDKQAALDGFCAGLARALVPLAPTAPELEPLRQFYGGAHA
jgi:hypothetical protein